MNKTTKLTKQNQQKQDKTNQDKKAKNADIEPLKDNSKQKEKTKPQIKKEMEIINLFLELRTAFIIVEVTQFVLLSSRFHRLPTYTIRGRGRTAIFAEKR